MRCIFRTVKMTIIPKFSLNFFCFCICVRFAFEFILLRYDISNFLSLPPSYFPCVTHTHPTTHTNTHTHTHTPTHIHTHTHLYINTHTHTYSHIHTHIYTHPHPTTHTHAYTHIHTHTPAMSLLRVIRLFYKSNAIVQLVSCLNDMIS